MEPIHRVFYFKSLIRYALALIVVSAALFARQALVNVLGSQLPPFITFYPAVMLIALLGGLGAGIFATIAATLCAMYYIIPSLNHIAVDSSADITGLSIFFCMGLAISIVSELYKRNREKIISCEKELEQTKVSDEIRLKDKLLHMTGEMARIGGWEFDAVSGKGTWTDEVAIIHDLDPADPTNVNLGISFYSGKSRELIENAIKDAIESAKPYDLELEMVTGRGNHKIVRTMGLPIMENNKVTKVTGIFQDITENRQAEEKIKAQERMLKLFVEYAPAAIAMFDRNMRYMALSRRFITDYRLVEQDIIGRTHYEIFPEIPERWREIHRRCLAGAIEKADKDPFPRSDGTLDYVRWEIHPWHEDSGEIGGIILFSEVITEQILAHDKIRESEEKFRIIADFTYDWEYWRAEDGSFLYVSPSSERVTGYSPAEFMNAPELLLKIIHPEDRNLFLDHIGLNNLHEKDEHVLQFRIITRNGEERWISHACVPVYLGNGTYAGRRASNRDITDKKLAEDKLQSRERTLKLFVEYAPAAIAMFDRDMRYLAVSQRFIADYRLAEQDIIGLSHYEIFPEIPESIRETHRRCLEGAIEKAEEDAFARADGTLDWVRWAVHPWHEDSGEIGGIILFSEVITEQVLAKNTIKESEEKYRLLIDSIKKEYFIYRNDINGVFTYVSPSVTDVLGYSDTELGMHYKEFLTDNPMNLKVSRYVELCNEGVPQPSFEVEIRHKDGKIRYLEIALTPLFDSSGKPDGMQGIAHDITERKRLDSERERMITAIEQAGEAIIVTDTNGIIQYVNPAFETITGYSCEETIGNTPMMLKSGEHDDAFYSDLWQKILSGQTWSGRFVNRRKNGKVYTEAATISPVRDSSGKIINFVGVKKDITDFIQLEKQFLQAQKMESVGRLAGGVAHDFNNMLSVILGYSELALTKLAASDPMHENFQQIHNAAIRSRDLTRQLLAFARKETIAPEVLNLNETVESMLKILRKLIGEDINLVWRPVSGLWSVKFDPTQLNQILANLCVNSRDAIDNVGHITIETDMVSFDDEYCKYHPEAIPGDFVILAVSDDGCGMSKETMDKIFEPFFTTKKSAQGTGLGLATVYGIVKQNNGFISVYSEPGQGTTFKVYLPRYIGKEIDEKRTKAVEMPRGRGETVLVVEDEVSILMLISNILQSIGYKVLTVDTPAEAIHLAEKYGEKIHLLLTDVIIPEMNGKELAEKLLSIHPHLRCIYMSGYTADAIAHRGVLDEGINFLQKPFSTMDLAVKVRMALDQKLE